MKFLKRLLKLISYTWEDFITPACIRSYVRLNREEILFKYDHFEKFIGAEIKAPFNFQDTITKVDMLRNFDGSINKVYLHFRTGFVILDVRGLKRDKNLNYYSSIGAIDLIIFGQTPLHKIASFKFKDINEERLKKLNGIN